jgi:hypothetical protein
MFTFALSTSEDKLNASKAEPVHLTERLTVLPTTSAYVRHTRKPGRLHMQALERLLKLVIVEFGSTGYGLDCSDVWFGTDDESALSLRWRYASAPTPDIRAKLLDLATTLDRPEYRDCMVAERECPATNAPSRQIVDAIRLYADWTDAGEHGNFVARLKGIVAR